MRKLNGSYGMEVLNGRLNGSAEQVENNVSGFKNTTFTKKIGNRSKVSTPCQKFNMKEFMSTMSGVSQSDKVKDGKIIKALFDPFNSEIDDIFGFMLAENVEISAEEYNMLDEDKKQLFSKKGKAYKANLTKKRKSRLQMNALINVSNRKVNWEWNVASSTTNSMPYQQEVYSGVHQSIFNLNIDEIGKFTVSNEPSEFRDYSCEEGKNVRNLSNEEVYGRVENVLNAVEFLSISSNQTNHLTDTKPKFMILADYSWGNNAFQGVLKDGYLDIDMLKECLNQNEKHRVSDVYIGVNKFFDDRYNNIREELEKEFEDIDFIHISNVQNAFEGYKAELKEHLCNAVSDNL